MSIQAYEEGESGTVLRGGRGFLVVEFEPDDDVVIVRWVIYCVLRLDARLIYAQYNPLL
jgi:hypothetical protein